MLQTYIQWLYRYHKYIVIFSVIFTLLLGYGVSRLTITNEFRVYFSKENPQLAAFEHMEKVFGKQDTIFFYIQPNNNNLFTRQNLQLIHELTEAGWNLPYAERVNSLTNFQYTEVRGDDLLTDYLVKDPASLDEDAIKRIRRIALNEQSLVNNALSKDGRVTGISVRLRLPKDKQQANDESVMAARALRDKMHNKYPDVHIALAGAVTAGVVLGEAVATDLRTLVTYSYIILIVGLLFLLRSLRGMMITVVLFTFSVLATMGIYGWAAVTLTPVAGWVPSIVMTIAVADCVHILISYFHAMRDGLSREEAVRESVRINANPVFVTSLTTIIGVLCLNFSDSPPYRDLGNMVAVGVFYAWILSMTFLPGMLFWFAIGKSHMNRGPVVWMDRLANWIIAQRKFLLLFMGAWVLVAASFIPRNELTERWHEYFDETFEQRRTIESINQNMTGVHSFRHVFDTQQENGIHDPAFLNKLEAFANWYRQQPDVAHVYSLADIQKRLNRDMHSGQPTWYKIPQTRDLAAQLFLLYEIGLPRELNLDDMVNFDRSQTLLRVLIHKSDSEQLLVLERAANQWLKDHAPGLKVGEATGLDVVFAHINHRNINALLKGTIFALFLISFTLIFALRSVRLGLMSLAPNLIPATLTYGTWGLLIGRVDLSASIVICMSLGIVVDDTVHFLSKYLRARREKHMDVFAGIRYAFNTVGIALTITTLVLVAGFLTLVSSHFSPTWVSGLLLAITLSYALLADFFFLPPLLIALDKRGYALEKTTERPI